MRRCSFLFVRGVGSLALLCVTWLCVACSDGSSAARDGGSVSAPVVLGPTSGLVSGGLGLAPGEGVDSVAVVGVSGTGLVVGVSGTGLSYGTIQDFGSIIINDRVIDTDTATFDIQGVSGSQAELAQGQQVAIIGDLDRGLAEQVIYRANLIGPVQSVGTVDSVLAIGSLQILGQQVALNAATVYSGTNLASLAAGQVLEISGIVDDLGGVTATFVRNPGPVDRYQLIGQVSSVAADSFVINGQAVSYDAGRLSAFEEGALSDGDVVLVRISASGYAEPAQQLVADVVEQLPRLVVAEASRLNVEGLIDGVDAAGVFTVQRQPVALTPQTVLFNGIQQDLQVGVRVAAFGEVDAQGVLQAVELYVESDDTVKVEGPLESVDLDAGTLSALGIEFRTRPGTDFEGVPGLDALQQGQPVEIYGYIDGPSVIAGEVELEDGSADEAQLRGPARQLDVAQQTFSIFDIAVNTDSNTIYEDFDDAVVSRQRFFELLREGVFVSAEWRGFGSVNDPVSSLSLEDD